MRDLAMIVLAIAINLLPLVFVAFMIAVFINMFN